MFYPFPDVSAVTSKQCTTYFFFQNGGMWSHYNVEFSARAIHGIAESWGQDGCQGSTDTIEGSIKDWKHFLKIVYHCFTRLINLSSGFKEVSSYALSLFYYVYSRHACIYVSTALQMEWKDITAYACQFHFCFISFLYQQAWRETKKTL